MKFIFNIFKLPKKYLVIILIMLAILGYFLFKPKTTAPKLEFAQVKMQDIRSTVSSSGNLTGKDVANLKFRISGKLSYINVKAGDTVKAYQVIAGLDTKELNIALQQAYNTFNAKDAAAKKAEDDVKNHSSDETYTQRDTRTSAQVARDNAYDSIKSAQRDFEDAVLVSPITGLVTQVNGLVGQSTSASDLVAQIVDTSELIFDTDIDEADISKIEKGQIAEITLDAYGDEIFKGSVDQILPTTKTTSSGATVITVKIKLDNKPKNFVNGLSGQATIILSEAKNVLTIPLEALKEDGTVALKQDQGFKFVKVQSGISSDTDIEIKEGLNENDTIILNPPATLLPNRQTRNPIQNVISRIFGTGRGGSGVRR